MKKAIYILFVFIFTFVFVSCEPQKTMPDWYSKEVYGEFIFPDIDESLLENDTFLGKQIIITLLSPGYSIASPETNLVYYTASKTWNDINSTSIFIKIYTNLHSWEEKPTNNVKFQGIVYSIEYIGGFSPYFEITISPAIVLNQ